MRFVKLNCNNCGAQLDIDLDRLRAYCPYCGQKLLIDFNHIDKVFVEKERTKQNQEQTKRFAMELDYKTRKESMRIADKNKQALIGFAMMFLVIIICLVMAAIEKHENANDTRIRVPIPSEDADDLTYEEAFDAFKNAGFTNIKTVNDEDLITGWVSKEGRVKKITINGNSKFAKNSKFEPNASIVITYHGFKDD